MSDPLSIVRNATMAGVVVGHEDGNFVFGNTKFAETTKTSFRRTLGKENMAIIINFQH